MTTNLPLRVGLIGCGYQGRWLARAAAETPRLRVTACADPDVNAAQQTAAYASEAVVYAAAEDLIAQADVDAVFVATPHHLLAPYALLAVRGGKHVLAEKPSALHAAEAAELETAVAQAGVTFMAGYSFRYFREPRLVHELLTAGAVGPIQAICGGIGRAPMAGR
jgi:predicted dehydrogenase